MAVELRDSPIFICGHPKAGTSLLRGILDSHPQLIVYPEEAVFFRRFLNKAGGLSWDDQLDLADELLIHIFTWNRSNPPPSQAGFPDRDYSAIPFEAVRQAMRRILAAGGCRHAGDILSAAIVAFGEVSGQLHDETRYWVEKSPYNELYTELIYRWWPQARCIHIVRDPRDNYASYRRKHPDWRPEFFAVNWKRSTRAGVRNREKFGMPRYWLARYEDLVQSPQAFLEQLTQFLDISWDPALTTPQRAGLTWQGNSMFAERFQAISTAPLGRWKESLSPQEAVLIEQLTQPLFDMVGYVRSTPPSLKGRFQAWSWPLRRRFSCRLVSKKDDSDDE
jgi:hypothetical protein